MKLSVVVPVYNAEMYLDQCCELLFAQGFDETSFEIVFVDDASTDGSAAVLARLAQEHANIRVVFQPKNAGAGVARNRGLELARGEYLYFFDADDRIEPDALSKLVALMDAQKLDVVFFSAYLRYENETVAVCSPQDPEYFRRSSDPGILAGKDMFVHQIRAHDFCAQPCVQLCRLSYVRACGIRFAEGIVNEDNEYVLRSLLGNGRCAMVPDEYYGYCVREGSVTTDKSKGLARFKAHAYLSEFCRERAYRAKAAGEDDLAWALCWFDEWLIECAVGALDAMPGPTPAESVVDSEPAAVIQRAFYRRLKERRCDLDAQQARIEALQARVDELEDELCAMRASTTWRVGSTLTALPRALKDRASK